MISKKLASAINQQINAEFWSAYLYLSMSNYAQSKGLKGAAHWFAKQFAEEQEHARRFMEYLFKQGEKVELLPIAAVKTQWDSLLAAFKDTLAHEKDVTSWINKLYAMATQENDYASQIMLQWFINEQVEEEEAAQDIVDMLSFVGDDKLGLYTVDRNLGSR